MTAKANPRLNAIFAIDAATCLGAGLILSLGAGMLEPMTGLPSQLSLIAGIALFPVAALFAVMATMRTIPHWLSLLGVVGNWAWVAGSLVVLALAPLNGLGVAFVAAQALAVAVLAWLEWANARPVTFAAA
jgi:hypothetical protein